MLTVVRCSLSACSFILLYRHVSGQLTPRGPWPPSGSLACCQFSCILDSLRCFMTVLHLQGPAGTRRHTYLSQQLAAVRSHCSLRMVAPQRHLVLPSAVRFRWTIQGQPPFVASSPPTMLLPTSAPGTPEEKWKPGYTSCQSVKASVKRNITSFTPKLDISIFFNAFMAYLPFNNH